MKVQIKGFEMVPHLWPELTGIRRGRERQSGYNGRFSAMKNDVSGGWKARGDAGRLFWSLHLDSWPVSRLKCGQQQAAQ